MTDKKTKQKSGGRQSAENKLHALRFARRGTTFLMRSVIIAALVIGVCLAAFFIGARFANFYIIVNEGMALRAECIITDGSIIELSSYFTDECIRTDAALVDTTYSDFTVDDYEYSLSVDSISIARARITVTERVEGIKASSASGTAGIPEWTPLKYSLELEKSQGRWRISKIDVLEIDPKVEPEATPDFSLEPRYTASPEPEITP